VYKRQDYALNEVIEYTQSDLGLFYHYDEKKNVFLLNNWSTEGRLTYHSPAETMQSDRLDCLSQAIARKEMIILNEQDVTYPFIIAEDRGGKYNSVSIPVVVNNQVVGVMWLGSQTTHYSVFDMKQVSLLLETTWILVEKQRLHDQLQ
jgi:transcriptional regulator with GAF, ATPase, and Fis domain